MKTTRSSIRAFHPNLRAASVSGIVAVSAMAAHAPADGAHFRPKFSDQPISSLDQTALLVVGPERSVAVVRTSLENAPDGAAWFMPVPARPYDLALIDDPFPALDRLTAPISLGRGGFGGGGGRVGLPAPAEVVVDARIVLGVMDIAVLSATGPEVLLQWLETEGYRAPHNAERVFGEYTQRGWWWIAVKLVGEGDDGASVPKPLAFTYDAPAVYPMTISSLSASEWTDVLLFVVADRRSTVCGPEGGLLGQTTRHTDRRQLPGDWVPSVATQFAAPIVGWLDGTVEDVYWWHGRVTHQEAVGDRWRTAAVLSILMERAGLPPLIALEGAATSDAEPATAAPDTPWLSRLRLQLRRDEMTWDLAVLPAPTNEMVQRIVP